MKKDSRRNIRSYPSNSGAKHESTVLYHRFAEHCRGLYISEVIETPWRNYRVSIVLVGVVPLVRVPAMRCTSNRFKSPLVKLNSIINHIRSYSTTNSKTDLAVSNQPVRYTRKKWNLKHVSMRTLTHSQRTVESDPEALVSAKVDADVLRSSRNRPDQSRIR